MFLSNSPAIGSISWCHDMTRPEAKGTFLKPNNLKIETRFYTWVAGWCALSCSCCHILFFCRMNFASLEENLNGGQGFLVHPLLLFSPLYLLEGDPTWLDFIKLFYPYNREACQLDLELAIDPLPQGEFCTLRFSEPTLYKHKIKDVSPLRVAA